LSETEKKYNKNEKQISSSSSEKKGKGDDEKKNFHLMCDNAFKLLEWTFALPSSTPAHFFSLKFQV